MMDELHQVTWSFCGRVGKMFVSDHDIIRQITPESSDFYRDLFQTHVVSHLVERGFLVESELIPDQRDNRLLVRHRKLPFVSYGHEWCSAMLRDAALFLLDLCAELARL